MGGMRSVKGGNTKASALVDLWPDIHCVFTNNNLYCLKINNKMSICRAPNQSKTLYIKNIKRF